MLLDMNVNHSRLRGGRPGARPEANGRCRASARHVFARVERARQAGTTRDYSPPLEAPPHSIGSAREALWAAEMGYRCIPCFPGTKMPAVKWKRYQIERPTPAQYLDWFDRKTMNIAVVTGDVVVFDCDRPDIVDLVLAECGKTPTICRTPHGGYHLWYRRRQGVVVGNHVRVKHQPVDVRAEGGLVLIPPSTTPDGAYTWVGPLVPADELPVARIGWTREYPRPLRHMAGVADGDVIIRRARAYVAHIEGAISGQRGHDRTMRVAGVLIQKFRLSIEQALPIFREWNVQCEPPWSEKELLHKLQDAHRLRECFPN